VKSTLSAPFDIGVVLEAVKERGEVVTKVAYSDWKRAGDYSRQLSQHAIRMVQRNLTPGGDKNGADINLALDALEMAFTHDHINAFVIVGGDSDFITLVEKLKQYDKKVFVVGGRQFTSFVMQKNCHEFIAYENLVSGRRHSATGRRSDAAPNGGADTARVVPLVKRALKVLADREVSPHLGLLKSTLLQLDSTFSERDYGASTFRDFIEKIAHTGLVTLRRSGRDLLVDMAEANQPPEGPTGSPSAPPDAPRESDSPPESPSVATRREQAAVIDAEQAQRVIQRVQEIFQRASPPPRWPLYIRQVKQYLRANDESFDERKLGVATIMDFLRGCQREGVFRLERDRRGILRIFPGPNLEKSISAVEMVSQPEDGETSESPVQSLEVPETGLHPESQSSHGEPEIADRGMIDASPEAQEAVARPTRAPRTRKPGSSKPAARRATGSKPAAPRKRRNSV
jgi:NYN domain/OST-HTH/LOTUS domain